MADTQDIELKPCPCCGAKAELTSGCYNDLLTAKVEMHDVPQWLSLRALELSFVADGLRQAIERDRRELEQ